LRKEGDLINSVAINTASERSPVVTVIPATIHLTREFGQITTAKRRVAAYARVSTDQAEQLTSYEAQVDYQCQQVKQ